LTVLSDNISPGPLWSSSWPWTLNFVLHAFLHPIIIIFSQQMPIPTQPVLLQYQCYVICLTNVHNKHLPAALAGRSSVGAVQAVCNGPPMSAAQGITVHDGLLHPHLRHCSSGASAVRRLPSAVRTATLAFDVQSTGLFCSWTGSLELATRLPVRSVIFL